MSSLHKGGQVVEARLRSWWQKIRQRKIAIVVSTAIAIVVVVLIIAGYSFDRAGFNGYTQVSTIRTLSGPTAGTATRTEVYQPGKTVWDWLQLLIVPLALAVIALLFNFLSTRAERKMATKRYEQDKQIADERYGQEQKIAAQRYEQDQLLALDKQREDLLQAYLNHMSELLLERAPSFIDSQ
jgi:flagellar biosynthesis/type III secretory pathway M-ring protein FliF/YscJ